MRAKGKGEAWVEVGAEVGVKVGARAKVRVRGEGSRRHRAHGREPLLLGLIDLPDLPIAVCGGAGGGGRKAVRRGEVGGGEVKWGV